MPIKSKIRTVPHYLIECCFIIDLPNIGSRARLEKHGRKVFVLCEFEGD